MLLRRTQSRPSAFNGEKSLDFRIEIHLATRKLCEGRELEGIKLFVDREEMRRVAGAETVCEFREREAVAEKGEFGLTVTDGREKIEDVRDYVDASFDGISREGDVTHWSPKS